MRDNVQCSNCGTRSLVEMGAEECPKCGTTGALAWVEGEPQEVRETRAPSAGAIRAARAIEAESLTPGAGRVADLVDRETGLAEARDALRDAQHAMQDMMRELSPAGRAPRLPFSIALRRVRDALEKIEGREEAQR